MKAFVDEYGNSGLDLTKDHVSHAFIISAVVINDDDETFCTDVLDAIAINHFSGSEIKSSNVGTDDKRRLQILSEFTQLKMSVYTVVVDKARLISDGFKYKQSFYKFLNGKLHSELYKTIPNLKVYHDNLGSDEYMESFQEYIHSKNDLDLFNETQFEFVKSTNSRLIQLADFLAGSYARIYDSSKQTQNTQKYHIQLNRLRGIVEEWPWKKYVPKEASASTVDEDQKIESIALHSITEYINRNESNTVTPDDKAKMLFLKYVYYYYKNISRNQFIYTRDLRLHLSYSGIKTSDFYIRSKIVAPLRDQGVLISSSAKGYKIPAGKVDIVSYFNHSSSIIKPMIARLKTVRDVIYKATGGTINVYEDYGFPEEIML